MDRTSNLSLPYIMAAQAQKHVTHNEAIRALDALVQLSVIDRQLATPPGSPAEGDRYIVPADATGAWAGQDGNVAAWQDGAWAFYSPLSGWVAWVEAEASLYVYGDSSWSAYGENGDLAGGVSMVGINTSADTTNRLSVKSDATLLSHDDVAPGTGGMQLKINKKEAENTASVLFQTAFSGRAEFGLTGDDNWHVKVSPDGSQWREALTVDRTTGAVRFPSGGVRELLTAHRTYYVRTDGSDTNTGLANTAGGAFLTIQRAIDVVAALDVSIFNVTIQVADGTYTSGTIMLRSPMGSGQVTLQGNNTTPGNVVLLLNGFGILADTLTTVFVLRGFELRAQAANNYAVEARNGSLVQFGRLRFGTGAHPWRAHFRVQSYAVVTNVGGGGQHYEIADSPAWFHAYILNGTFSLGNAPEITLTGTPAWGVAFIQVRECGNALIPSTTLFTGSATGARYSAVMNGVLSVQSAGANFLPGSSAGTVSTGGLYV